MEEEADLGHLRTPVGTGGGKHINRNNYLPPPTPIRDMPEMAEEAAPWAATYGQWTGNVLEDVIIPPAGSPEGCYYDDVKAQKAVDFISRLYHFEGAWSGHRFRLMHWQDRFVRYVFGWMKADGTRLIRRVYLEIPRKNGKSMFAAALALYLAFGDGEPAPQVFFAAADKEQAGDTYNKARIMVEHDEILANEAIIYGPAKKMIIPNTHGELRTLSNKTLKQYGLNLHGLVFDELMVQKTRELWDALTTAQGARLQPLIIAITTAGWSKHSLAYEQHDYARRISIGDFEDPSFLGVLYTIDEDSNWEDPENWKRACPSLGETVSLEYYAEKCQEAMGQPSAQNSFRTLMLCQWVGQMTRVLVMEDWDKPDYLDYPEDLEKRECYGGLDMSSTTDLTAFALVFHNTPKTGYFTQYTTFWLPGDGLRDRSRRDMVDYQLWVNAGLIRLIPGPVIKDEFIREAIRELSERFKIKDISYDRWGAAQLARELEEDGFTLAKMSQGYASLSSPTKEYLRLVKDHKLIHGMNPVLRWMAENVAGTQDPNGNVKFDKAESGSRIDGLVAGVMALDGATRRGGKPKTSVYNTRGPDDFYLEKLAGSNQ